MTTPNKTFLLLLETLLLWLEQTQNRVNDQFVCVYIQIDHLPYCSSQCQI